MSRSPTKLKPLLPTRSRSLSKAVHLRTSLAKESIQTQERIFRLLDARISRMTSSQYALIQSNRQRWQRKCDLINRPGILPSLSRHSPSVILADLSWLEVRTEDVLCSAKEGLKPLALHADIHRSPMSQFGRRKRPSMT
jgi:hypothetical protein